MIESFRSSSLPVSVSMRRAIACALLGMAVFAGSWGVLHADPYRVWLRGDLIFYENWGNWTANHQVPYKDFRIEYPPGALPVFTAPFVARKWAGTRGSYGVWFRAEMLVCGLLIVAAMAWSLAAVGASRRRLVGAVLFAGLAPLAVGPITIARYDLWPAALAAIGLAFLVSGKQRWGIVFLALGTVAKIYPAVLLPLALTDLWRKRGRREAAIGAGLYAAVVGVCVLPFLLVAPHGFWWSVSHQAGRPLQIESVGAAVYAAAHEVVGASVHVVKSHGSDNLGGSVPDAIGTASSLLVIASLVAVYVLYARSRGSREQLLLAAAAAVTAYIAFNKVFSPQYLIWLFPVVPLVAGRRGLRACVLLGLAILLTQIWEPYRYEHLLQPRPEALELWLVVVRDAIVVALLGVLLWRLHAPEAAEP
jgi:hypothetical protein